MEGRRHARRATRVNAGQRRITALTLAAIGVACLFKAFAGVHTPEQDLLIVHVAARWDWSHIDMTWLIGGIVALGAAALLARGDGA